jgi:hypothetical protein
MKKFIYDIYKYRESLVERVFNKTIFSEIVSFTPIDAMKELTSVLKEAPNVPESVLRDYDYRNLFEKLTTYEKI